jgi:tRNA-splicing ligase RtcB
MEIEAGEYFAVLSHSGSRGLGANIAKHYTYPGNKTMSVTKECTAFGLVGSQYA